MIATLDAVYATIADPLMQCVFAFVGANFVLTAVDRWRSGGAWARP